MHIQASLLRPKQHFILEIKQIVWHRNQRKTISSFTKKRRKRYFLCKLLSMVQNITGTTVSRNVFVQISFLEILEQ